VIVRQYGTRVQSVQPDFDANALNEIGFRRDNELSMPTAEFFEQYAKSETHELTAAAEGEVQSEAEQNLLHSLHEQLMAVADSVAGSAGGEAVLFIESDHGTGYPKTRHTQTTQVVEGMNRLYFRFTVEPPLRVAVYRRR
jgi:hypothetical protein